MTGITNVYYNHSDGVPPAQTRGISANIRNEYDLVQAGFDKLPTLANFYSNNLAYAVDTGAVNSIVVTLNAAIVALVDGMSIDVKVANTSNSTAPTINVNGLGATTATRTDGTPFIAGDLVAGQIYTFKYNATTAKWQTSNPFALTNPTMSGTVTIPTVSIGNNSTLAASTAFVAGTVASYAPLASPALTGIPTAPTATSGTSTTQIATTAFVASTAFSTALPGQGGHAGQFLTTDGTNASFVPAPAALASTLTVNGVLVGNGPNAITATSAGVAGQVLTSNGPSSPPSYSTAIPPQIIRQARTSNVMLAASDNQNYIDITSGTFTQTFAAPATLGNGWFCYLGNSGTGDITMTLDGVTFSMYTSEIRLVQSDGTSLRSIVINGFSKVITVSGNFIKPPGYTYFEGYLFAAGASGSGIPNGNGDYIGGAGGACTPLFLRSSDVSATTTCSIGIGGVTSAGNGPMAGGVSTFGAITSGNGKNNGNGGAAFNYLTNSIYYAPTGTSASGVTLTVYGGGTASGVGSLINLPTIYGGAVGGGVLTSSTPLAPGTTVFGGAGGNGINGGPGANGVAPGGGGGASNTAKPGDGARGELRLKGLV